MAVRGGLPKRETVDLTAILLILGGLGALIALIALGGGFILATATLFVAVSTAFGRRAYLARSPLMVERRRSASGAEGASLR